MQALFIIYIVLGIQQLASVRDLLSKRSRFVVRINAIINHIVCEKSLSDCEIVANWLPNLFNETDCCHDSSKAYLKCNSDSKIESM